MIYTHMNDHKCIFPMASFKEVDEMCVQKAVMELQAKSCE